MAHPCQILRIACLGTTITCAFCLFDGLSLRTVILCCQSLPHLRQKIPFPKIPTLRVRLRFSFPQLLTLCTARVPHPLVPWVRSFPNHTAISPSFIPPDRTSNIPSRLHNCETCGPPHPSDCVKAPSLNLESTFMRRPAALFFLLIFFATLSNAQQRASINPAPASSAASQRTPTSPAITASASTKITRDVTKRLYKGHLKTTWACPVPDTKFLLTRKSTPAISIRAHVVKPAKKASKSVVTPHANTDNSQSLESAQFKGRTVALYSPQLFVGNSSPTANKPPGA